jgi:threonine/homoserine/homoserine lactone efflux protein
MMTVEHILAFVLFAAVAAVTPGPSNVMLAAAGANAGIVKGMSALLGVAIGMGLMMFVVPFGLGSVVLASPLVLTALHWCGAAFLLWLAYKIASASHGEATPGANPVGFTRAAIFQWVNPKSWLVSVSAAGTFLHAGAGSPFTQSALLGGLFFLVALPCCFVWLVFGATAQRLFHSQRSLRIFNFVMGVLLALSVVLIIAE